jgi:hypothetical protein
MRRVEARVCYNRGHVESGAIAGIVHARRAGRRVGSTRPGWNVVVNVVHLEVDSRLGSVLVKVQGDMSSLILDGGGTGDESVD